jgi:alkanesulfonate monooxygenase
MAARYAAEFNLPFDSPEFSAEQFGRVRDACTALDRDPDSIVLSNALTVCCGADEAELKRRADAIGVPLRELRTDALAGTPNELVDRLGQFTDVGSQRCYLQVLDISDLDHLELIATKVMPQLA